MPALDTLTKTSNALRRATSISDIGLALLGIAQEFRFQDLLIVEPERDIGKASVRFATMLVEDRTVADYFDTAQRCVLPTVVETSTHHAAVDSGQVLVIPVHEYDRLYWCVCARGLAPDLSARTKLILGAAAHAAYARYQSLATHKRSLDWGLSAREQTCLDFVSLGKTDAEIGRILQISPRTVRFHVQNGKTKLGVATRVQAVAKLSAAHH